MLKKVRPVVLLGVGVEITCYRKKRLAVQNVQLEDSEDCYQPGGPGYFSESVCLLNAS